jgi:parallel beta-helix repeat protein
MKTLDQVEARIPIDAIHTPPVTSELYSITQPGSYYVTGDITFGSGLKGIRIASSHVTVDLNGFQISGGGVGNQCILVLGSVSDVEIRNGVVTGSTSTGIDAFSVPRMRVIEVRVSDCTTAGITVGAGSEVRGCVVQNSSSGGNVAIQTGNDSSVIGCISQNNVSSGIRTGDACIIKDCRASHNGGDGIQTSFANRVSGCTAESNSGNGFLISLEGVVTDCAAYSNAGNGFFGSGRLTFANCMSQGNVGIGIAGTSGCSITNCSASDNGSHGFSFSDTTAVHNCAAENNTGDGIIVGLASSISNGTFLLNKGPAGISASQACTIIGCAVRGNTNASTSSGGIITGTECIISRCVVSNITSTAATLTNSTGMGISVGGASTVEHNTVQGCKGDGIRATSSSLIIGNTSDRNGDSTGDGAGIHTNSIENRIEGNSVTGNDRGIDVDSTGNLIIKNTAATNTTDYEIAASNRYGAIINITAAGAAAVSGNSAVTTLTSTDPWANYSY